MKKGIKNHPKIKWDEQHEWFGIDYTTKRGTWGDFTFDIRYDYDGDPTQKPVCNLILTTYFNHSKLMSAVGTLDGLTTTAENYLKNFLKRYF